MPKSPARAIRINAVSAAAIGGALCVVGLLEGCSLKAHSTPEPPAAQIPCNPGRVLKAVCQKCHSSPPQNMAPFPLVTYADTHAIDGPSGKPIWSFMFDAVSKNVMPLPPVMISPGDRQVLLDWLSAGAPAAQASDSCTALELADAAVDGDASDGSRPLDAADPPDATQPEAGAAECGGGADAQSVDASPEAASFDAPAEVDSESGEDAPAE
jgi:hypothetical protein